MSVLLRSKSFQVTDGRRGQDYSDRESFARVLDTLKENMEAIEKFIAFVIEEFKVPLGCLNIIAMGKRRFLGSASRERGYIKLTPCPNYSERTILHVLVHELGHIITPIGVKWGESGPRRDIHGNAFKANTYKLCKYAFAVGLLKEDEVRWDLGLSFLEKEGRMDEAASSPAPQTMIAQPQFVTFRVGDVVTWTYSGYKHGGRYTGKIVKVTTKKYKVTELTRNDQVGRIGMIWTIPKTSALSRLED